MRYRDTKHTCKWRLASPHRSKLCSKVNVLLHEDYFCRSQIIYSVYAYYDLVSTCAHIRVKWLATDNTMTAIFHVYKWIADVSVPLVIMV